ncbi:isocitrate dehydrogenase [NAD] subunit gamma, mitochondrial-like isoform X1 [Asterias rubens]|uniref:isocitrate dehydrogenase [NAD] subunit gamma, mitochondrial-like isoform X1 n=2 Tax=Asterias rubens TaxID=7604 RepID=UPI0014554C2F|nr:isocitrate dehydrogenase [NAD] subunit gamma, mitochondrial-like isoform X1 [Asterias rubens]
MAVSMLQRTATISQLVIGAIKRPLCVAGVECSLSTQKRNLASGPIPARYGGWHTVTIIPGDGIGPELMPHVKEVFRQAGAPVDFEELMLSGDRVAVEGEGVEDALVAIKRNGTALKGNIHTHVNRLAVCKSNNVRLRVELDLFANVVQCKSMPGLNTRHSNIDIAIIRENTEGEYSSLEHESVDGVVESLKIITADRSKRIAKYAFDFATRHNRSKVTAIHKANIMKLGDGLFLESCREVSKLYPKIEFGDMIVDNCCMQLVSNPTQFDVMVMPNLYGNIISNIGTGLVGGPGMVPGQNIGEDFAVFETATRNTGKTIAGKNVANPSAMLLAGCLLLRHLGLNQHADLIHSAVIKTVIQNKVHTADLGGTATTSDVVEGVIRELQSATY